MVVDSPEEKPRKKSRKQKNVWAISRDDTLRGKIRRLFFRTYVKTRSSIDKALDMVLIHSSKFSLFALFVVSASRANLFNAGLFILFLMLSLITSYRDVKKYWKLPIIFNSFIIIVIYGIDVFQPTDILNLDRATLSFIGIKLNQGNTVNFAKYNPYLILLVVLAIT